MGASGRESAGADGGAVYGIPQNFYGIVMGAGRIHIVAWLPPSPT